MKGKRVKKRVRETRVEETERESELSLKQEKSTVSKRERRGERRRA